MPRALAAADGRRLRRSTPSTTDPKSEILKGTVYTYDLCDAGYRIAFDRLPRGLKQAPAQIGFRHQPRLSEEAPTTLTLLDQNVTVSAHVQFFDFAVISRRWSFPFEGTLDQWRDLAVDLKKREKAHISAAQQAITAAFDRVIGAIDLPELATTSRHYTVFRLDPPQGTAPLDWARQQERGNLFAQMLTGKRIEFAVDAVETCLGRRMTYASNELTVLDWGAGLIFDTPDNEDIENALAVVELANGQIPQMRVFKQKLDAMTEKVDRILFARPPRWWRMGWFRDLLRPYGPMYQQLARVRSDVLLGFEIMHNPIADFGDRRWADLFELAKKEFQIGSLYADIQRQLRALTKEQDKFESRASSRRMELMEASIVAILLFEILRNKH